MKKIILSLAGVMAAVAMAPEASAVPVFARQTGMACSACHFNHFPLLNGFGRAFKAAGYTMMGSQEKVEGENLSIPSQLNMAYLATAGFETQTRGTTAGVNNASTTGWFVPTMGGESQLFIGGKVNDMAGFLSEFGTTGPAGAASAKLHIMPQVGDMHVGVTLFSQGQGAAGVMEMLNTGATSIHRLMGNAGPSKQHINAYAASQYVRANNEAGTGIALNAVGDNFAVTVAKETDAANAGVGTAGVGMPFTYVRAVGLFNVADLDAAVGLQSFSGTGTSAAGVVGNAAAPAVPAPVYVSRKATVIDGQLQGEIAGKSVGLYASYGRAPADTSGVSVSSFNGGTLTRSSFNIAADVEVMPHTTLQAALRSGKSGVANAEGDNAFYIGAAYALSMNMEVSLAYTTQSGSYWNTVGGTQAVGKNATTVLLETLF